MRDKISTKDFAEWVDFVFNREVTDPALHWADDAPRWVAESTQIDAFATQLFRSVPSCLEGFSDEQISQGLSYITSDVDLNHVLKRLPDEQQIACYRAMHRLFGALFLPRCSDAMIDDDVEKRPLDMACYMWWDNFRESDCKKIEKHRAVNAEAVAVMEEVLLLPHTGCRESALHGLGHFLSYVPACVPGVIDRFLERHPDMEQNLREYALGARKGAVL